MKNSSMRVLAGVVTSVLMSGIATAQKADELTVTGSRFVETPVGINHGGIPIKDVSLSVRVAVKDLDLKSDADWATLNRRVMAAARAACIELERLYPISHPDTATCTRAAAEKAAEDVRQLVASVLPTPSE